MIKAKKNGNVYNGQITDDIINTLRDAAEIIINMPWANSKLDDEGKRSGLDSPTPLFVCYAMIQDAEAILQEEKETRERDAKVREMKKLRKQVEVLRGVSLSCSAEVQDAVEGFEELVSKVKDGTLS